MNISIFWDGLFLRGGVIDGFKSRVVQMSLDIKEDLFLGGVTMTGRPKKNTKKHGNGREVWLDV